VRDKLERPLSLIDVSLKDDSCTPAYIPRELHDNLLEHGTISIAACTGHAFVILTRRNVCISSLVAVIRNGQNIFTARYCHELSGVVILMDTPTYTIPPAHDKPCSMAGYNIGIPSTLQKYQHCYQIEDHHIPFSFKWTSPSPFQTTLTRECTIRRILSQKPVLSDGSTWGLVKPSTIIIISCIAGW